ncbi:MAG: UDP-glucose/GDP-mannose dehydrogenase family protein, partial [Zetaproteobacteria bacterium]
MKLTVIGTGYVGLVAAACFAEVGNRVVGLDRDPEKIRSLTQGRIPIYEPGLEELVRRNLACRRLSFTTDYPQAVSDAELVFIAVGTPPDEDGSADLSHVIAAAREAARHARRDCLFVLKSTVPVGAHAEVEKAIAEVLDSRENPPRIRVVNNPEFLREGQAVGDFLRPARVIVGVEREEDAEVLHRLYVPFTRQRDRFIVMDRASAEMTKYASNAMLATRISFMNELSRLCGHVGADIEQVRKGMGMDPRIGSQFLYAGVGYGGSCFPKDVRALLALGKQKGEALS